MWAAVPSESAVLLSGRDLAMGGRGGGVREGGWEGGGCIYNSAPFGTGGGQKKLFSLQCTQWAALLCVADGCELL